MQVHNLRSRKLKSKKRVGRGGKQGTYSGKGMKGQKSRSGYSRRSTWEGGRTTLIASTKKNKGFKSRNLKNQVLSIKILDKHFKDGDIISPEILKKKNLIKNLNTPVKILGKEKISKKFKVKDILFSKNIAENIIKDKE